MGDLRKNRLFSVSLYKKSWTPTVGVRRGLGEEIRSLAEQSRNQQQLQYNTLYVAV